MCKNEQTIHYCTILSAGQWDFLLDGKAAIDRQKCLHRLMTRQAEVPAQADDRSRADKDRPPYQGS